MKITKPRIIAYVITCLLPLFVIGIGIILVLNKWLLGTSICFIFIIFPLIVSALLFPVIFSKISVVFKVVLCIGILIIFSFLTLVGSIFGSFEQLLHYENPQTIPQLETETYNELWHFTQDFQQPEEIDYFYYFSSKLAIFTNDVHIMICQYNETDYKSQKELIENKYIFQTEPMNSYEYACEPTASIDGYIFKSLSIDDANGYDINYPKDVLLIATNDETQEIVYLSAYDDDIDYIDSLVDFINNDCGWKHMR